MKFSAVLPTCEIGDDPIAIRDWAQAAEALGYSHILAYDHVLGAEHRDREPALSGPYTEEHAFHEPFVVFGFLAGVTTTIGFETAVIILPQRQTAIVAKQAAQVAVLSRGRLRLGVGTGWNYVEYQALGADWGQRGKVFDDQIGLLRALWTQQVVEHDSTFHHVDRAGITPRPRDPIPIWFGGFSNAALRRAARLGDGFTFPGAGTTTYKHAQLVRDAVAAEGRDVAEFPIEVTISAGFNPSKQEELIAAAAAADITYVALNTMSTTSEWLGTPAPGLATPAEHIAALEAFMRRFG
jgi:probable F420-dependent oxidoreductase